MSTVDLEWEKQLKIRTTGRDDTNSDTYKYPYEPTPYAVLERIVNTGMIRKNNVLVDYGCGKGRVDFFLSYQTRCKSIGIEYDERLFERALDNKSTATSGMRVEIINQNATEFIPDTSVDRFYFFNPFSIEIFKSVMSKILDSYYEEEREIYLFFYYPSDEYIAYLMSVDELEFYDEIDCRDLFLGNDSRERVMIFSLGAM